MQKRVWVTASGGNIALNLLLGNIHSFVLVSIAMYISYEREKSNTSPGYNSTDTVYLSPHFSNFKPEWFRLLTVYFLPKKMVTAHKNKLPNIFC